MKYCELTHNATFRFSSRMDTAECGRIEDDLKNLLEDCDGPIVFDLGGVEFICSTFLRLCMIAQRKAGAHGFAIENVDPEVKRVFKIAGLDKWLKDDMLTACFASLA